MWRKISHAIKTIRKWREEPLHIEFNLTDYCNLNCKGCTHYSPLAPEEYEPLERLERDARHIAGVKNAALIREVYLIGGETLLYPQLTRAIRIVRRHFPWVKLSVFTNGLLIPKMDEDFWKACRETDCEIALTRYPLKIDYDRIERICREKGVTATVFGDRGEESSFFRFPLDPEKKQNRMMSHIRCFSFGCITIDGGRIYPCSLSACVKHLNTRLGTDFRHEKGDYIEVEKLTDARQLLTLRNRPVPFCGYCKRITDVKYGPSRRSVEEWVDTK